MVTSVRLITMPGFSLSQADDLLFEELDGTGVQLGEERLAVGDPVAAAATAGGFGGAGLTTGAFGAAGAAAGGRGVPAAPPKVQGGP